MGFGTVSGTLLGLAVLTFGLPPGIRDTSLMSSLQVHFHNDI